MAIKTLIFRVFAAFAMLHLLNGCASQRANTMFMDPDHEAYFLAHATPNYTLIKLKDEPPQPTGPAFEYKIRIGDQLNFQFFNYPIELMTSGARVPGLAIGHTALVDVHGEIALPLVGRVQVLDSTLRQAEDAIIKKLSFYYKDPKINITIANLRVFVYGDVRTPGVLILDRQETHLVEVLARAGGIQQFGKVNKVKIIRGDLEDPQIIWVNMRNIQGLKDPDLYIHDRDIIFIETRNLSYALREAQPYLALLNTILIIPSTILLINQLSR